MKYPPINRAALRVTAGLIQAREETYGPFLEAADRAVGPNMCAEVRKKLAQALRLNIQNRNEYPFYDLQRKYGLPLEEKQFAAEKSRYVRTVEETLRQTLGGMSS